MPTRHGAVGILKFVCKNNIKIEFLRVVEDKVANHLAQLEVTVANHINLNLPNSTPARGPELHIVAAMLHLVALLKLYLHLFRYLLSLTSSPSMLSTFLHQQGPTYTLFFPNFHCPISCIIQPLRKKTVKFLPLFPSIIAQLEL